MKDSIKKYIKESADTKLSVMNSDELLSKIEEAANIIIKAYKDGKKVLTAGNGGSAADAQHIAAELVSKFMLERKALNSIALTTNSSIMTAVGNDFSHEFVFMRQIEAYGQKGDVFIAISTSGNSVNIVKAIEEARKFDLKVIGLTGKNPSKIDDICDVIIKVPSSKTSIIQEVHIMVGHIICGLVEKEIFL